MSKRPMKDIIVLLPGIMGSVLERDGKPVWDLSGRAMLRFLFSGGNTLKSLTLTDDPVDAPDLGDGITSPRLLPDAHMIPGLWKIDGYTKVADTIKDAFDLTPGENYFEFPYDWRRDNRVAAKRLATESKRWLSDWRERSGNDFAQIVLLAHSMGGLVARYFLECCDGWRDSRALITFGTPHRGAVKPLDFISNGVGGGVGPIGLDLSETTRSFTSIYQLLPTFKAYDGGDGNWLKVDEAEIPNVDRERATAALGFHDEIKSAVEANRADAGWASQSYTIHPFVGTRQPTLQSARLVDGKVETFREAYNGKDYAGDGSVPRVSATPWELSNQSKEIYSADAHASLQNSTTVLHQVIEVLAGHDMNLFDFKGEAAPIELSLDLEDLYLAQAPIELRVQPDDEAAGPLEVVVTSTEDDREVARTTLPPCDDEWRETELAPLEEGAYRVTVSGGDGVSPVSDMFTVLDPKQT